MDWRNTREISQIIEGCSRVNIWKTLEDSQKEEFECHIVGNKLYSLISVESHHSKWVELRKLAKKNSATEECSFLLKRMELE
jgi:hypothetical protein